MGCACRGKKVKQHAAIPRDPDTMKPMHTLTGIEQSSGTSKKESTKTPIQSKQIKIKSPVLNKQKEPEKPIYKRKEIALSGFLSGTSTTQR